MLIRVKNYPLRVKKEGKSIIYNYLSFLRVPSLRSLR